MSFQHVSRIARGKQDLDALVQSPRFAGNLNAANPVWHHDVTYHKIKFLALEHAKCFSAVPSATNLIARPGQHRRREVQKVVVVLDNQDSLRPGRKRLELNVFHFDVRLLRGFGQVESDSGPPSQCAFDRNVTAGLTDKAVDHAKAEPGAFANLLRCEEGLKHPAQQLGGHSKTSVSNRQPD